MSRALRILLVDDEKVIHSLLGDYLRQLGHTVSEAYDGQAGLAALQDCEYDLMLTDVLMPEVDGLSLLRESQKLRPGMPVAMISAYGDMNTVIEALRLGAADFLPKPIKFLELEALIEKCLNVAALRREKLRLQETVGVIQRAEETGGVGKELIGDSAGIRAAREQLQQFAAAECESLLITGETGTGKEVCARAFHRLSSAARAPFIAIGCPAIPGSLVESELFGHVKGAFTDASSDRTGCFELAEGGTLFLDEIGDLSLLIQAKLLRVLESRTLRRIGGSKAISVDIRVVAATNAPLDELVASGNFRQDLLYRLNAFTVHLLPLRERREDIVLLAKHFLAVYAKRRRVAPLSLSPEAEIPLAQYDYPGNVRELRNIVERAIVLCDSGEIRPEHLRLESANDPATTRTRGEPENDEAERILRALENAKWNRRKAAKLLDMPYSTFRYKLKRIQGQS